MTISRPTSCQSRFLAKICFQRCAKCSIDPEREPDDVGHSSLPCLAHVSNQGSAGTRGGRKEGLRCVHGRGAAPRWARESVCFVRWKTMDDSMAWRPAFTRTPARPRGYPREVVGKAWPDLGDECLGGRCQSRADSP